MNNAVPAEDYAAVAVTVESLRRHLQEQFAASSVRYEEPFIRLDDQGTVITGTIDMLVETGDGFWVIDHKSDQVDKSKISAMAEWYYPQLKAYGDALTVINPDKIVKGIMINWIGLGMLTVIEIYSPS